MPDTIFAADFRHITNLRKTIAFMERDCFGVPATDGTDHCMMVKRFGSIDQITQQRPSQPFALRLWHKVN